MSETLRPDPALLDLFRSELDMHLATLKGTAIGVVPVESAGSVTNRFGVNSHRTI